jgi:hypothetical protein
MDVEYMERDGVTWISCTGDKATRLSDRLTANPERTEID